MQTAYNELSVEVSGSSGAGTIGLQGSTKAASTSLSSSKESSWSAAHSRRHEFDNCSDFYSVRCVQAHAPQFIVAAAKNWSVVDLQSHIQLLNSLAAQTRSTSEAATAQLVNISLNKVYALDRAGKNREAAQELLIFVDARLRELSLPACNQLLLQADFKSMSSRSVIGLLRSTLKASKSLPAWRSVYKKSRAALVEMGKDPDLLFVGMPSVEDSGIAKSTK